MNASSCTSCYPSDRISYAPAAQSRRYARPTPAADRTQVQARELQQTTSRSGGITITTAEGDKVTLSFAARDASRVAAYNARGRANGDTQADANQQIRGWERQSASASQVNVGIEGNLNEREMGDIQKLLAAFGQATQGDFSGLAQFGSLESLSAVQMNYSYSQQANYGSVSVYA